VIQQDEMSALGQSGIVCIWASLDVSRTVQALIDQALLVSECLSASLDVNGDGKIFDIVMYISRGLGALEP
jgi:hypothetical protein